MDLVLVVCGIAAICAALLVAAFLPGREGTEAPVRNMALDSVDARQ